MNISGNTILITGGGSGIGLETARLFVKNNNHVIITGRNEKKLQQAAQELGNTDYIVADLKDEKSVENMVNTIKEKFGHLNILMNNAGEAYAYQLLNDNDIYAKAVSEMQTNYLSLVLLTEKLTPLLKAQPASAIINVSSIVAFSPSKVLPTYSPTKAALHSYTQVLRLSLSSTPIKVFEVMPPLVDTELAKDLPSPNKISPVMVAEEILEGLSKDTYEIRVASTEGFYQLYLQSPEKALHAMNGL